MKWSNLTFFSKALITLLAAAAVGSSVYFLSPGLRVEEAKQLDKLEISNKDVNNLSKTEELPVPEDEISATAESKPLVRIGGYAWNAQSGIIVANGGSKTSRNSLMEKNNVNLEIVRQDWLSELRNLQMKFVD